MHADMGAQLMVREIEADVVKAKRVKLDALGSSFVDLPYDEAVALFMAKKVMTPQQFYKLSDEARARGFTATRLLTETLRQRAQDSLASIIENGGSLDDFVAAITSEQETLGVGGADIGYLDTVFRTNVLGAYGAGRYRAITSPDVMKARPFVQYRTAGDSRVRESHAAMDGLTFRTDDSSWHSIAPPNGFNCRCTVVTLAQSSDVSNADDLPEGAGPDEGFAGPPAMKLEE